MKNKFWAKILSLTLTACLVFSAIPVFANQGKQITLSFEDVTATDASTLSGEAKIKVSVQGASGNVSIAQTTLSFSGNVKYKAISYLKGSDNPSAGDSQVTSESSGKITTGIISSKNGMDFGDDETLFVITFSGEPGEAMTLALSDLENTYFVIDGKEYHADNAANIDVTTSSKQNSGKKAVVNLTMNKLSGFSSNAKSGITVTITSENTANYSIENALNNAIISKGGHRDASSSVPKFTIENTVLAGDTYTVEVSGIGYLTYKKTGVTFDKALEITNAEFMPGDVNGDGKVDADDKALVEEYVEKGEKNEAADFNRDGRVDADDLAVFSSTSGSGTAGGATGGSTGGESSGGSGSAGGGGGGSAAGGSGGGSAVETTPSATTPAETTPGTAAPENTEAQTAESFTDLGNHAWAKDAIYTLKNKGIISGVSETQFAPANNIKRGDFILILTRMLGINNEFSESFADVPQGSYYYQAIGSAKAAGIAQGSGDSFRPEESITRQDLITLAYRAFLAKGYISQTDDLTSLDSFSDKGEISDYAQTAMASMVKAGIIQGSDGKVNPKGNATRAEVAVMCARLVQFM